MPAAVPSRADDDIEIADISGRVDPGHEDRYWQGAFLREHYYRPGLDYEDYAPAYCVGYIGFAQYGGAFEDAEKSLCANWERIRGDSRLSLDQALAAMRAAWDRMSGRRVMVPAPQRKQLRLRARPVRLSLAAGR